MKILHLYATYSSGTLVASEIVDNVLGQAGHDVELKRIKDAAFEDLQTAELLLFATPSWFNNKQEGQPHEDWLNKINQWQGQTIAGKLVALFGLGDTSYDIFCGGVGHLEAFADQLQLTRIIDTLRIDGFFYDRATNDALLTDWAHSLLAKIQQH